MDQPNLAKDWNSVLRLAWTLIAVSSIVLIAALVGLTLSLRDLGDRFSMIEIVPSVLALLSAAGLGSGIGLLKRQRLARYSTIAVLVVAGLFLLNSLIGLLLHLVNKPSDFLSGLQADPLPGLAVCMLSLLGVVWCAYSVSVLRRPVVRNGFGA